MMVTETMLLLALKQKNWAVASQTGRELFEKNGDSAMNFISKAADMAASGNRRALILLNLWARVKWQAMN